jgi:hypothetical protein
MQKTNLSIDPYYDDFDESKNFHRILFRAGYSVQGRELTQMQTILQNQIERFGSHVFKEGSPVSGAQTNYYNDVVYVKLESTHDGQVVDVEALDGEEIVDFGGRGVRARIIAVEEEGTDSPTLMIRYVSGEEFEPSDIIALSSATSSGVATIRSEIDALGTGSIVALQEGIFYVRGHFVHTPQQIVILDKYGVTPTYDVGLEITEDIVTEADDTSLLDPALDASNYQAPGAHRFTINLTFNKRTPSSVDLDEFIRLMKIEDGEIIEWVRYPIYNELEKTLARRTYDESGNYTVRSFRATVSEDESNNAQYIITLDPGKAYVFGFEFETIAPTEITVAKPRTFETVSNYDLSINFGNYVYLNNANGVIDHTALSLVDLHCVQSSAIDFGTLANYTNTRIGQARVRDWVLDSVGTSTLANTYVWRAHLFDVNTFSLTANCGGTGTINTIQLGSAYSSTTNAYNGVIITLEAGPGTGDRRTITSYNGASKVATVDSNFSEIPTAVTQYKLNFGFKDTESIAIRSTTSANAFADVTNSSKDSTTTFNDAYLADENFDKLIFPLPYSYVVATDAANGITGITDVSGEFRQPVPATLSSNTIIMNLTGAFQFVGSVGVQSALAKQDNWSVSVTNPANSTYARGAVVPVAASNVTITLTGTQTANLTLSDGVSSYGGNSTVHIVARVSFSNAGRKTKSKVVANTTVLAASGAQQAYDASGVEVPGCNVFASFGQVNFANTSVIPRTPDSDLMIYIPDVYALVKVVDSKSPTTAVTLADISDASKDITSSYSLDTGQRDGVYDHARIRLKAGATPPSGQIRVFVSYYEHDTASGYFSVDSYPAANTQAGYNEIPEYTMSTGETVFLRDMIDIRPRKTIGYANTFPSPVLMPCSTSEFTLDFAYYLARIDYLVLTRDRRFEVIKGIDSLNPQIPRARDDAMLLNVLRLPPYVGDAANNIGIRTIENKRYTMRDIGTLEKRINTLEYYTTLSLLERAALRKNDDTILDDQGLERSKNGIIVDSFADFSSSDMGNDDYQAAIDVIDRRLKPTFNNENYDMLFVANTSSSGTYQVTGPWVTLPWGHVPMIYQNVASKAININPFNVTKWAGTVNLSPPMDTWIDTQTTGTVTNPSAGQPLSSRQTLWSSWTNLYTGHLTAEENNSGSGIDLMFQQGVTRAGVSASWGGRDPRWGDGSITDGVRADGSLDFQIGYMASTSRIIEWEEIRTSQGTRIINTTIIPFIRSRAVVFNSKNMRPNTAYYPYFDGTSVLNYVRRANIVRLDGIEGISSGTFHDEQYDTYGRPDILNIYDATPPIANTASARGSEYLLSFASNTGLTITSRWVQGALDSIVNQPDPIYANNQVGSVIGWQNGVGLSGTWWKITQYQHYSGNVVSATTDSVFISPSAHANSYFHAPSIGTVSWATLAGFTPSQWSALGEDAVIRIVSGTGAGQSRLITGYTLANNRVTVNTAWTTTPDTTSGYSIGVPRSVTTGHIGGVFHIPNTSIMRFRTGDRLFKLTDSPTNTDAEAASMGSGRYSASGTLQEVHEDILVTRRVKSERNVTEVGPTIIVIPGDPLAQSFYVDPVTYPMGAFVSGFRFMFKTKDNFLPVRCQIRTMVNGFPHANEFIAETVVNPQYVKTTDSPNLADINKYTEFLFSTPVYVAPAKEYAFVLLSDSNQYNVYVSEFGGTDIVTGSLISRQPTLGSLFKSQNGSTWTPVQEEDLMFGLYICQFDTTKTANVNFRIYPTSANANVDMFYMSVQQITPPSTDISYKYSTTPASGGVTAQKSFVPNITTNFDDQSGRRVFIANSNASFSVYATMTSNNAYVSPAIDTTAGLSVFAIENRINNGELSNTNLVITNGGTGYLATDNANISISISGGGGSGAAAVVNAISNGVISQVILTSRGSGYYTTPTVSITFNGNSAMRAANSNLAISIVGETSPQGGNALMRYVMKKVKLAEGLDSSDIRVYLTTYRPPGSSVYVYYKVLSGEDPDVFENKEWNVMTQVGNSLVTSRNKNDLIESTYAPGTNGVAEKEIIYDGYSTFRTFAIKVVALSNNPIDCPEFKDIRVIALPSGKTI